VSLDYALGASILAAYVLIRLWVWGKNVIR